MLKCLYYPYSRPRADETIKRALLLFDEIAFLDSQPEFVRRALSRRDLGGDTIDADAVDAAMAYGVREGVVRTIDTSTVIQLHGSIITAATVADVGDDRFAAIALRGGTGIWSMLKERLPEGFLGAFYPGVGTFMESVTLQEIAGNAELTPRLQDFSAMRWGSLGPEAAWKMLGARRGYRFVVGGNPHMQLQSYEVPFLPASSLRINEALLVAAADGYVPFTDSVVHDRLLRVKALNARSAGLKPDTLSIAELASEQTDQASLSWLVLDKLVSSEQLAHLSFEDILRYRAANQPSLSRLRRSLAMLSDQLAGATDLRRAEKGIESLVDRKILAEVEKAQQDVANSWQDFVDAAFIRTARGAVPAVAVTILAGMDLIGIVMAAAAAGAAVLGGTIANDAIGLMQAKRKSQRHDFSYLTELSSA